MQYLKSYIMNSLWRLPPFSYLRHCSFLKQRKRYVGGEKNITILASNCIGTEIYHVLGLKFNSPTINLWMHQPDFLNFCSDLDYYLSMELSFDEALSDRCKHPVGILGEREKKIFIYFMHYPSKEAAKEKWEERKKRIIREKICLIMNDRDGITENDLHRYAQISCWKKILFSHKDFPNYDFIHVIGKDKHGNYAENYQEKNWYGFWKWERKFDCVKWLKSQD